MTQNELGGMPSRPNVAKAGFEYRPEWLIEGRDWTEICLTHSSREAPPGRS